MKPPIQTMAEAVAELASLKESSARLEAFFGQLQGIFGVSTATALPSAQRAFIPTTNGVIPILANPPSSTPIQPRRIVDPNDTMVSRVRKILGEAADGAFMRPEQVVKRYKALALPEHETSNLYSKIFNTMKYLKDGKRIEYVEGKGYRLLQQGQAQIKPGNNALPAKSATPQHEVEVVEF